MLSAAFATMLLSTCFLLFILWFCCFTTMKQKKISAHSHHLKRCLIETELNLNKIGITSFAMRRKSDNKIGTLSTSTGANVTTTTTEGHNIKVRDAAAANTLVVPSVQQQQQQHHSSSRRLGTTMINTTNPSDPTPMFHPYDSLHLRGEMALSKIASTAPPPHRRQRGHSAKSFHGNVNPAFQSDYEYWGQSVHGRKYV